MIRTNDTNGEDKPDAEGRKSRTQKKKEALGLQDLGEKLLKLSDEQLRKIEMPEELYDAVTFVKSIRSRSALKRQRQYIGALIRHIDTASIEEALHNIERGNHEMAVAFKETEQWRDELIAGNDVLMGSIAAMCSDADRHRLAQLVRNARKEKSQDKSVKARRALFRFLREIRTA